MKVSVIIPIYNVAPYIRRCAESVLNQNIEDYEVVFVNDATPDKSMDILREVLAETRSSTVQVKIVEHSVNKGLGVARNSGLAVATGEWIVFIDSDDWVNVSFIANLLRDASHGDLVCGGVQYEYGEDGGDYKEIESLKFDAMAYPVANIDGMALNKVITWSYAWGKLFDREVIQSHDIKFENITPQEDTAFVMSYLLAAKRVVFSSASDYHYIKYRAGSLTKKVRTANEYVRISDVLLERWEKIWGHYRKIPRFMFQPSVQRFGLSQLLQAVLSAYVYHPECRNNRIGLLKVIRLRKPLFGEFYVPKSLGIKLGVWALFFLPIYTFDFGSILVGWILRLVKGTLKK